MNNINRMIREALAATGAPVALLIEPIGDEGVSAALVEVDGSDLGETITYQNDWKMSLAAQGGDLEEALKILDAMCAEDFAIPAQSRM